MVVVSVLSRRAFQSCTFLTPGMLMRSSRSALEGQEFLGSRHECRESIKKEFGADLKVCVAILLGGSPASLAYPIE